LKQAVWVYFTTALIRAPVRVNVTIGAPSPLATLFA